MNGLIFPADFYVINTENDDSQLLLLRQPFLKTSRTKIDMHNGNLTMEFDGNIIKFDINDAMRYPGADETISFVDIIDPLSRQIFNLGCQDKL